MDAKRFIVNYANYDHYNDIIPNYRRIENS